MQIIRIVIKVLFYVIGIDYQYVFFVNGYICSLLITFWNSLDPDQMKHRTNLDPTFFTLFFTLWW